jgi:cell division protein FtsA
MVLTGGGSLLRHIDLLSEYHTGMPTRVGHPVEHLAHGYSSQLASPIFATAVGLLKHAIDNRDVNTKYVEHFENPEESPFLMGHQKTSVNNREDEDDTPELPEDREKRKGLLNKLYTYTKEFFETVPDSEF